MPTDHASVHTPSIFPLFLQENVSLIKEINELRRELKFTRSQVYDLEAALKLTKKVRPQEVSETGNVTSGQGRWALGRRDSCSRRQVSLWLPSVSGHIST